MSAWSSRSGWRSLPLLCGLSCLGTLVLLGVGGCAASRQLASRTGGTLSADAQRLILVTVDNRRSLPAAEPGSTPHGYADLMTYTVSAQARAVTAELSHDYHLREVREWPIAALKVQCVVFGVPPETDRPALVRRLSADHRVRLAEPLQLFVALSGPTSQIVPTPSSQPGTTLRVSLRLPGSDAATPFDGAYNDPYYGLQYGFRAIHAAAAQRWSRGRGVTVAIIDTGIDLHHPDLHGQVLIARDFVGEKDHAPADATSDPASEADRHGTGVAGIVAAVANNRLGIVGVAPAAKLLSFKACEPIAPHSLEARCNSFTLALALAAAIEAHAQVVNLSLTGPPDALLAQLVRAGERRGMLFVGAVPENGRLDGFPLAVAGVIPVDEPGRSLGTAGVLHAPGNEILSLAPGGRYDFVSGSSFAAAHVSGALALLRAQWPHLEKEALLQSLLSSSTGGTGDGAGDTINVCAALHSLEPRENCTPVARVLATAHRP